MQADKRNELAKALDIPLDEQHVLDAGVLHDYRCRCVSCLRWWVLMGPDGDEAGNYGPFSLQEVLTEARRWGKPTDYLV